MAKVVVPLCDGRAAEGIGFYDIGSGFQKLPVYFGDNIGPRETEQFVVAFNVGPVVSKAFSTIVRFNQVFCLNHRAHRTVDDHNPLL